jgi:hypothetical protein
LGIKTYYHEKKYGQCRQGLRLVIVIAIAILYFFKIIEGTFASELLALAGIFLVTGLIGFCPAYSVFGIKTCSSKKPI